MPRHRPRSREGALTPRKLRLFRMVMILVPFLALGAVELLLRAVEYGGHLDLVVRRRTPGGEMYCINRSVARRYFPPGPYAIPEPSDETFALTKPPKTRRIFCLGESTMAGFPYEYNATVPGFLRDRLQAGLPGYTFEVINVGLSAVGSHVVLDFIKELADYEPDLFVIYVGHNEFYGVYGAGSAIAPQSSGLATGLLIRLLRFRTVLALRDLFALVTQPRAGDSSSGSGTLMQAVIGNAAIAHGSTLYHQAAGVYEKNLNAIISEARDRNIPVLFGSLVSNLRDQPPFRPVHDERLDVQGRLEWDRLALVADSLLARENAGAALTLTDTLVRRDSLNARGHYLRGRALYAAGEDAREAALRAFVRARDLDALRFRASEDFQQILLGACAAQGARVARLDSAFAAASPRGIPGHELFLEHLHPNIRGYDLMAATFVHAIRDGGWLAADRAWRASGRIMDSIIEESSTVTAFDTAVGKIRTGMLVHRPPFQPAGHAYEYHPATPVEELALRYVLGRSTWQAARYDAAGYYASQGKFAQARRECRAVARVLPFSYEPMLRIADYFKAGGNAREAEEAYIASSARQDNPFAHLKLGILLLEASQDARAAGQIRTALALDGRDGHALPASTRAESYYLLAVASLRLGQRTDAGAAIRQAITLAPSNQKYLSVLKATR